MTEMVLGEVKKTFNPEFINRVDEIIVFEPLSDDDLRRITLLLVDGLNQHLAQRQLSIRLSPEVVDWIIEVTCRDRTWCTPIAPGDSAVYRRSSVGRTYSRPVADRRGRGLP